VLDEVIATDVVILAPTGRDGPLAQQMLRAAAFHARLVSNIHEMCDAIAESSGVLLIAEEVLNASARAELLRALEQQPTWSDIPILILTGEGELSRDIPVALRLLASRANVTLIERPVRIATLVTALRSAMRARMRQYDLREYLLERLASEEALLAAQQQAEAANKAKSQFLTTMSHELRTPLNAIAGYTELLMLGLAGPVTDKQKDHLKRIERSERHLLALINDVLNFAKIEAGQTTLDVREVDMTALVDELETFVKPQLLAKRLEYKENIPAEPIIIYCDAEKVRQILLNLLSNAVKFTKPGGHVEVSAARDNSYVVVSVTDDGDGIAADKVDSIFEPFVQIGRAFNSPSEGTGLGLAISRDLAKRMGGDLTCISEVGGGSTFTLRLPA
jgi:signal transduction histidine kinase